MQLERRPAVASSLPLACRSLALLRSFLGFVYEFAHAALGAWGARPAMNKTNEKLPYIYIYTQYLLVLFFVYGVRVANYRVQAPR